MKCIKFIKMKIISLVTFFFKLLSKFTARTSQSILMESKDRERGREREKGKKTLIAFCFGNKTLLFAA